MLVTSVSHTIGFKKACSGIQTRLRFEFPKDWGRGTGSGNSREDGIGVIRNTGGLWESLECEAESLI